MADAARDDWQIPAFTLTEFAPRQQRYLLMIPVLNEGERILRQLGRMAGLEDQIDIAIVDGGSTDGSLSDPTRLGGVRAVAVKTGPGRLGAQLRIGLAWGLDEGYEGIVLIDGNDKDDPSAVPLFIHALDEGCDHVQGSRYIPGGAGINTPLLRHWGVRLLHAPVISLASRVRYTDTTNGFRAYSRRFLLDPRVQPFRDVFAGYELHYYLAMQAGRLGFKVAEVPVTRRYPAGPTPTKIRGMRGNLAILKALALVCSGRFDPEGPR